MPGRRPCDEEDMDTPYVSADAGPVRLRHRKNDTVSYALEAEPASLDPAMTTGLAEANVQAELFED